MPDDMGHVILSLGYLGNYYQINKDGKALYTFGTFSEMLGALKTLLESKYTKTRNVGPEASGITKEEYSQTRHLLDSFGNVYWSQYNEATGIPSKFGNTNFVEIMKSNPNGIGEIIYSIGVVNKHLLSYQINDSNNVPIKQYQGFSMLLYDLKYILDPNKSLVSDSPFSNKNYNSYPTPGEVVEVELNEQDAAALKKIGFDYDEQQGFYIKSPMSGETPTLQESIYEPSDDDIMDNFDQESIYEPSDDDDDDDDKFGYEIIVVYNNDKASWSITSIPDLLGAEKESKDGKVKEILDFVWHRWKSHAKEDDQADFIKYANNPLLDLGFEQDGKSTLVNGGLDYVKYDGDTIHSVQILPDGKMHYNLYKQNEDNTDVELVNSWTDTIPNGLNLLSSVKDDPEELEFSNANYDTIAADGIQKVIPLVKQDTDALAKMGFKLDPENHGYPLYVRGEYENVAVYNNNTMHYVDNLKGTDINFHSVAKGFAFLKEKYEKDIIHLFSKGKSTDDKTKTIKAPSGVHKDLTTKYGFTYDDISKYYSKGHFSSLDWQKVEFHAKSNLIKYNYVENSVLVGWETNSINDLYTRLNMLNQTTTKKLKSIRFPKSTEQQTLTSAGFKWDNVAMAYVRGMERMAYYADGKYKFWPNYDHNPENFTTGNSLAQLLQTAIYHKEKSSEPSLVPSNFDYVKWAHDNGFTGKHPIGLKIHDSEFLESKGFVWVKDSYSFGHYTNSDGEVFAFYADGTCEFHSPKAFKNPAQKFKSVYDALIWASKYGQLFGSEKNPDANSMPFSGHDYAKHKSELGNTSIKLVTSDEETLKKLGFTYVFKPAADTIYRHSYKKTGSDERMYFFPTTSVYWKDEVDVPHYEGGVKEGMQFLWDKYHKQTPDLQEEVLTYKSIMGHVFE